MIPIITSVNKLPEYVSDENDSRGSSTSCAAAIVRARIYHCLTEFDESRKA